MIHHKSSDSTLINAAQTEWDETVVSIEQDLLMNMTRQAEGEYEEISLLCQQIQNDRDTYVLSLSPRTLRFYAQVKLSDLDIQDVCQYSSKCPITMSKNLRKYNATVSHGESRMLQGDESDVSLAIPAGAQGVYISRVHTDHSWFDNVIPKHECFIGPPVEVEHLNAAKNHKDTHHYVLSIPHSVSDKYLWKHIRVRHGNLHKSGSFTIVSRKMVEDEADTWFEVDDKFIKIHTSHFSQFICTSCKESCSASVMAFVLARLRHIREVMETSVEIKTYLCSSLYKIRDYRKVMHL